ncbi:collagen alpha-1(I) chain-like, partial [Pseudonaja textilis]|uniref:collagen alpha-1(I) chain-like n=1 Tax=Pseudonaja textilis TaxID=8673 RepID=UPI000EA9520F
GRHVRSEVAVREERRAHARPRRARTPTLPRQRAHGETAERRHGRRARDATPSHAGSNGDTADSRAERARPGPTGRPRPWDTGADSGRRDPSPRAGTDGRLPQRETAAAAGARALGASPEGTGASTGTDELPPRFRTEEAGSGAGLQSGTDAVGVWTWGDEGTTAREPQPRRRHPRPPPPGDSERPSPALGGEGARNPGETWRRGKEADPGPRQPRRRRPRPRPGGAPTAQTQGTPGAKNGHGGIPPSPCSGLRKFPSEKSDAPEAGERSGSRAGPPGASTRWRRQKGRTDESERRATRSAAGRRPRQEESTPERAARGGANGRTRRAPPGKAGGLGPANDGRGQPSSRRRRTRVPVPSVRVAATGTEARRPGGPARVPPFTPPGRAEAGQRTSAPPRTSGARRHPVPHAPEGGGRAGRRRERRPQPGTHPGGESRTGRTAAGPGLPSASLALCSHPRALARPSVHPFSIARLPSSRTEAAHEADAAVPLRRAPSRTDGPRRSPVPPKSTSVGAEREARTASASFLSGRSLSGGGTRRPGRGGWAGCRAPREAAIPALPPPPNLPTAGPGRSPQEAAPWRGRRRRDARTRGRLPGRVR